MSGSTARRLPSAIPCRINSTSCILRRRVCSPILYGDLAGERRRQSAALREKQLEEALALFKRLEHRLRESQDAIVEPGSFRRLVQEFEEVFPLPFEDSKIELVFARKELVDAANTETGLSRDVADRGGVISPLAEYPLGGLKQAGQISFAVTKAPLR